MALDSVLCFLGLQDAVWPQRANDVLHGLRRRGSNRIQDARIYGDRDFSLDLLHLSGRDLQPVAHVVQEPGLQQLRV